MLGSKNPDIVGDDNVEQEIDGMVGILFELLTTPEMGGMDDESQQSAGRNVSGLVGLQPASIDASLLIESCSEPLDSFHSQEEKRHKLSFWAFLHGRNWRCFC